MTIHPPYEPPSSPPPGSEGSSYLSTFNVHVAVLPFSAVIVIIVVPSFKASILPVASSNLTREVSATDHFIFVLVALYGSYEPLNVVL